MGREIQRDVINNCVQLSEEEQKKAFIEIKEILNRKKVVIYGAGAIGRALKMALDAIGKSIEFYCDKRAQEIREIGGVPVEMTDALKKADSEEYIIIIAVYAGLIIGYSSEIKTLLEKECPRADIISSGRNLAYLLQMGVCKNRAEKGEAFQLIDCINCGHEERGCKIFQRYLLERAGIDPDTYVPRKFEKFFGLILGNMCTLKCKHCNEMVPYYKQHKFNSFEQIMSDCKKVIDSCTFMPWIEFVGGEPFLHPQIKELIREVLQIRKIGYLKIFTNGTVVPDDELCQLLKNDRIIINFSDYTEAVDGRLLENIYKTHEKLQQHGIRYIRSYARTWQTFSFEMNGKDEKELEKSLACCSCAECQRLHNGILYRCHHQYAGMNLEKIPVNEDDIIRIYDYDDEGLRERCDYFEDKKHILACKYCNWPFDAESVPAAQQVE